MARVFVAVLMLSAGILVSGCGKSGSEVPPPPSKAEQVLGGEHVLRKMVEMTELKHSAHGSFFLVVGEFSAETTSKLAVKFAWRMNDGTYAISSLPIEKIRVKFDEQAK